MVLLAWEEPISTSASSQRGRGMRWGESGDYSVRCGVMRNPVIKRDIESTQTLHLLLRSSNFVVKLITHEIAGILHWSEQVQLRDTQFVVAAKEELQEHLKLKMGLKLDFPDAIGKGGTMEIKDITTVHAKDENNFQYRSGQFRFQLCHIMN